MHLVMVLHTIVIIELVMNWDMTILSNDYAKYIYTLWMLTYAKPSPDAIINSIISFIMIIFVF